MIISQRYAVVIAAMLACLLFMSATGVAEEKEIPPGNHQSTAPPEDARYEIVQSQLAVKWTFKLDRYTGKIYQLAATEEGLAIWGEMLVWDAPDHKAGKKPRYQIMTSGLTTAHSFLLDTETGKTWLLTERTLTSKEGKPLDVRGWFPIKDQ
ncbi:MAG: hypothetical protein SWH61_04675 [Thermodesulfobacteriota bacterium]|nr:hypothetical protein [Thermodesulfobacteriota bacterium]